MAAIYKADIWCDDCARAIREKLIEEGKAPTDPSDEYTYDSDDFPKYADDDAESDTPQHCANGKNCCNAETLPSGHKIGCLIGTNLTDAGLDNLRESLREGGEVAEFWYNQFSAAGYDDLPDPRTPELGFICLGDDEDEAVAECGCKLTEQTDTGRPAVFLCPLHAAAPELLKAFTAAVERMGAVARGIPVHKRNKGVSQAAHVAHMAGHLEQHAIKAREVIDRTTAAIEAEKTL